MTPDEYSFLQKLSPDEFKDKLRSFIVNGREIFERGEYALVFIDSRDTVYALHSTLFDDREYYHDWWVTVDVLSFYHAHYPELVKGNDIAAIKIKNLDDCWIAVPNQFNSQDWEAIYTFRKNRHTIVLLNKDNKVNEPVYIKSSIHSTAQIAIDSAYKWFEERSLDITDLGNWIVE